jgi:hypothetical protein
VCATPARHTDLLELHCCYIVVTFLLHSFYILVTFFLHSCYILVTLLLNCCYIVVTLLLHCKTVLRVKGGCVSPQQGMLTWGKE